MRDDLLRRAASALREETREADEGARFTRARMMASLQQSEHRRRTRLALVLPLAACFAAATAWGTVSGRTGAWVSRVGEALGLQPAPAPKESPKPAAKRGGSKLALPPVTPKPTKETPPESASSATPAPAPTPVLEAVPPLPTPPKPAPSVKRSAPVEQPTFVSPPADASAKGSDGTRPPLDDISDRAHELYRVAHRSHFVEHDFTNALRAWEAYLSEAPGGRFALEARYNRALCLVRLGRKDEARAALAPFAAGNFGDYRRQEATQLIDALAK